MISRRRFTAAASLGLLAAARDVPADTAAHEAAAHARLRELEAQARGRLGVYVLDSASGQAWGYRADERFMMLSSFKLLASALVLQRVDTGQESLQRRIPYTAKDLVAWSPVTEKHADGDGMTLAQLCQATITTSDNTAANLILSSYGGPAALTAYARRLGDTVTRLDRNEPALNVPTPDGLMDTTSPRAMAGTMQQLLLGDALCAASRELLEQWLLGNTTGDHRLKAGLPPDWRIGDKTGTNKTDANDIAIVLPPRRAALLVGAYLADSPAPGPLKDATLAAVGRLVSELAA